MMALPSIPKWQYHLSGLAAGVAISLYGIAAGKPVLQIGTFHFPYSEILPFPYPLTTTLFQSIFTYLCLSLGFLLRRYINKSPDNMEGQGIGSIMGHKGFKFVTFGIGWATLFRILPLALTTAAEATLSNYALFNVPFESYVISRALILPFLLLLGRFFYSKASIGNVIYPSLILSINFFLIGFKTPLPNSGWAIIVITFSSILSALWLLQIQAWHDGEGYSTRGEYAVLGSREAISKNEKAQSHSIWALFYYLSLISMIVLFPVVLCSGEVDHIMRNCYFLHEFRFWAYMTAGAISRLGFFTSMILLVQQTSALDASVYYVLVIGSQVSSFTFTQLGRLQLSAMTGASLSTLWYVVVRSHPDFNLETIWKKNHQASRQRFYMLVPLVTVIIGFGTLAQVLYNTHIADISPPHDRDDTGDFPASLYTSMVQGNDSYLGSRPQANTIINLRLLIEECGGMSNSISKDVFRCLEFLATDENSYLMSPNEKNVVRSNDEDLEVNEEANPKDPAEVSSDTCDGPVIPYHIWGDHLPTWRIELFIKAYLHTQNLQCSRLWIWVDGRHKPDILSKWWSDDRFRRFMPLIESGDIFVKEWILPARVPLPPRNKLDEVDQARYYSNPGSSNFAGERLVADSVIQDASGQEWLQFYEYEHQITYYDRAISDIARFTIVHMHGGIYLDSGAILLRDIRPLLLSNVGFVEKPDPREPFGNALIALPANSSVSSYMLRGGTRMGLFFHAVVLQRMFEWDGRNGNNYNDGGLIRLEDAIFDPIWAESHGLRDGRCTVPCLSKYVDVFKATPVHNEWESFDGESLGGAAYNRTMENFFRGAFAYHIHGQKKVQYERGSWMDVICSAHDRWFAGIQSNPYGERWDGPPITTYRHNS